MQYDSWGSNPSGTRNGNLSGLPRNSFRSDAAMETGPAVVPIQMYQQVTAELESVRQQVSRLSSENQRLRALHQQLSGEITAVSQEFQGQLGHTLKRLQQISQAAQAIGLPVPEKSSDPASQENNPPSAPSQPRISPTYDFLNRLKQRQARHEIPSFPPNGYSPSSNSGFEPSRRPQPFNLPSRQETLTGSYPRASHQVPSLEDLTQDMGSPDLYTETYPSGIYQRVREQHHGSQGSAALWLAGAVILVIGSFGLGFVAVQPFLRSNPPSPVQAP